MKKTLFTALIATVTLGGLCSIGMSSKKEHVLTSANVEALSRSELGEACGGCSTNNNGKPCCTIQILGISYDLYDPRP